MSQPKSIAVLGAGIAGLSVAHFLSRSLPSYQIVVYESCNRPGGWIRTQKSTQPSSSKNVFIESGPRSIRPRGLDGWLTLDLVRQLNLESQIICVPKSHPSAKNRFIYHDNQLVKLPSSFVDILTTAFSPQLGFIWPSILFEPFRPSNIPNKNNRNKYADDETLHQFFSRRFGTKFSNTLISALIHGIYAGNHSELSINSIFPSLKRLENQYGSVILGSLASALHSSSPSSQRQNQEKLVISALQQKFDPDLLEQLKNASVWSLHGGLQTLVNSLYHSLDKSPNVKLNLDSTVNNISPSSTSNSTDNNINNNFQISTTDSNGTITHRPFSHVVSGLPSNTLQSLIIHENRGDQGDLLNSSSVTVATVTFAFDSNKFSLPVNGFGFLIPQTSKPNPYGILGVVFDSDVIPSLDDSPAPTKLTVMMGGHYWNKSNNSNNQLPSSSVLKAQALEAINNYLGTSIPEPILSSVSINKNCIPQYNVGHNEKMSKLHSMLTNAPWNGNLSVLGSSYAGVGINDIVGNSYHLVNTLQQSKTFTATGLERLLNTE